MRGATTAARYFRRFAEATKSYAGYYEKYVHIDWNRADRFVFVCTGNICRSPYAEARANALGLKAESFGTRALSGKKADHSAVACSSKRGLDLSGFRSKSVGDVHINAGDVVLLMQEDHLKEIPRARLPETPQISLLGLWSKPSCATIPDPFQREPEYFEAVFSSIDLAIQNIARRYLVSRAQSTSDSNWPIGPGTLER